ncbi:MAG: prepilin-type N-terminal cleavage/methylation domain-containing protein [Bacilli bacterium]
MRNKKGTTLTEVIVSIVIIGIISLMMIHIFSHRMRIEVKFTREEQLCNTIESYYIEFTNDPLSFIDKYNLSLSEIKILYYDNAYINQVTTETDNAIEIRVDKISTSQFNLYIHILENNKKFERTIYRIYE